MNITEFTIVSICLVAAGFAAGYALGPIRYSGELARVQQSNEEVQRMLWGSERDKAAEAFYLVQQIHDGNAEKTASMLNQKVDMWIASTSANAQKGPWINPDMEPCSDTSFLARVARHRATHPVTYIDQEHSEWMANILSTAIHVEKKRYKDTEHQPAPYFK